MRRILGRLFFGLALSCALPCAAADSGFLALTGATLYLSPEAAPLRNGVILVEDGRIRAIGAGIAVPTGARTLDCTGLFVTAGFQNSHVHFSGREWLEAAGQPGGALAQNLRAMLTRYGFTTVMDTGSELANTLAMRRRIETHEIPGPRILTAGGSVYPGDGVPFYVKERVPPEVVRYLHQPATPAQATAAVQEILSGGADAIKIFTGSIIAPGKVLPMKMDIATAAVAAAHAGGVLAYAHPSNDEGIQVALEAGVDILAHTAPRGSPWDAALAATMHGRGMSLTPTLKLWAYEVLRFGGTPQTAEAVTASGVQQLRAFALAGGQVLFGTDVGYMADYDPTEEYVRMAQAGLTPMQVLASLTTAPAARFGESNRRGRIEPGMDADFAVLEADPALDVRNFSKVRYTLRAGRVIFAP